MSLLAIDCRHNTTIGPCDVMSLLAIDCGPYLLIRVFIDSLSDFLTSFSTEAASLVTCFSPEAASLEERLWIANTIIYLIQ
jgi:hypothetical protein